MPRPTLSVLAALLLPLTLILPASAAEIGNLFPSVNAAGRVPEPATIAIRHIEAKNEKFDLDAKIPEVGGLPAEVENKIRAALTDPLADSVQKLVEDAQQGKVNGQFRVDYADHPNRLGLISLTVIQYEYTGGAHGRTTLTTWNFDRQTGQRLKLPDLFVQGADFVTPINEAIRADIVKREEQERAKLKEEDPNWHIYDFQSINPAHEAYLENDQLMVPFAQYEIAPYAWGMPTFAIPLASLRKLLKPGLIEQLKR